MTINAPAVAPAPALRARRRGAGRRRATQLRGTVQNDILKEYVARGNYIFPPRPSMRLTTDLFAYCARAASRSWNTISISGYHIREAGSTAVQELAFTLANGIAYCEAAVDAGLSPDEFGARLSFFFNAHNDFFQEVAKFRAARRLWARDHARPLRRDEPEGAGAPLPRADRRLDADGAAAGEQHRPRRGPGALGRLRRRAVAPHERASTRRSRCRPSARRTIALRTQQILAHEAGDDRHGRPARRLVLHRGAHRRARGAGARADRARSTSSAARSPRSSGLRPGRDRGGGVPLAAARSSRASA